MTDINQFESLARAARAESPPPLDVAADVMSEISRASVRGRTIVALQPGRPRHVLAHALTWTVAASLLVGGFFVWNRSIGNTATAALTRAIAASERFYDLTYRIEVEHRGVLSFFPKPEATLYVRGGRQFVLRHPSLLPGDAVAGSNGEQFWVIPAWGPVRLHDDLSALPPWFVGGDVSVPLLNIHSILKIAESKYDIELLDDEFLPEAPNVNAYSHIRWQRLRATRRDTTERGPDFIDLWVHPKTGQSQRAVLTWGAQRGPLTPRRLTIDLADQSPLPDNWFQHATHHRPERPVKNVAPRR